MSFADAVKTCLRKYATFTGTASRPEYWWFFLFNSIGGAVFRLIGGNALESLWSLAFLLPGLGVAVRRLHDTGRSAWWLFTGLIPPWLIVLLCLEGKQAGNPYVAAGASSTPAATITEKSVQPSTAYCSNCGKMRLPGQEFCASCGAKLPD